MGPSVPGSVNGLDLNRHTVAENPLLPGDPRSDFSTKEKAVPVIMQSIEFAALLSALSLYTSWECGSSPACTLQSPGAFKEV